MSTEAEIRESVALLRTHATHFVLLHCNSTYPAPFKDINLAYLKRLAEIGQCLVGYSGHERDVYVAVAAVANGAKVIEKHLTLDRNMEGNDHRVSLLPGEFARMVQGIRQVESALGSGGERRLTQGEMMNRETLAKSVVAKERIEPGQTITAAMLDIKSPGNGLQPNRLRELVGRRARRAMATGALFFPSDLQDVAATPRNYQFERPWGIPVRYHDFRRLRHVTNLSLIEFHLSYKDMDLDPLQFLDDPTDLRVVVHSPELFAGDHVLDLCSADDAYRQHSIAELQRVIDVTRQVAPYFRLSPRPCIVTNVGGFTADAPCRLVPWAKCTRGSAKAWTASIWTAWRSSRRPCRRSPGTSAASGTTTFSCRPRRSRVSAASGACACAWTFLYSKLACNHHRWSFHEFLATVGPYAAHLHMADAAGVDGEGLQIGEGDVDWVSVCSALDRVAASAAFIPRPGRVTRMTAKASG